MPSDIPTPAESFKPDPKDTRKEQTAALDTVLKAINSTLDGMRGSLTLLLGACLTIAALVIGTTDEAIFRDSAEVIPALGVKMQLKTMYIIAPAILLFLHVQVLLSVRNVHAKIRFFMMRAEEVYPDKSLRDLVGGGLNAAIFIEAMLPAASDPTGTARRGGWPARAFFVVSVFVIPCLILLATQISFVRYQSWWVTGWHMGLLAIDVVFISLLYLFIYDDFFRIKNKSIFKNISVYLFGFCHILFLLTLAWFSYAAHPPTLSEELYHSERLEAENPGWELPFEQAPIDGLLCARMGWGCRYLRLPNLLLVNPNVDPKLVVAIFGEKNKFSQEEELKKIVSLKLRGRSFLFAELENSRFYHADFTASDFSKANMYRTILEKTNLQSSILRQTSLTHATLTGANLRFATLTGANLRFATLTGADLRKATLTGANLTFATLTGADLGYATLTGAYLGAATLTGADLGYATLTGADLRGGTLTGADLGHATLTGADLREATLTGTIMRAARFGLAEIPKDWLDSGASDLALPPAFGSVDDCTAIDLKVADFNHLDIKTYVRPPRDPIPAGVAERLSQRMTQSNGIRLDCGGELFSKLATMPVDQQKQTKIWLDIACDAPAARDNILIRAERTEVGPDYPTFHAHIRAIRAGTEPAPCPAVKQAADALPAHWFPPPSPAPAGLGAEKP